MRGGIPRHRAAGWGRARGSAPRSGRPLSQRSNAPRAVASGLLSSVPSLSPIPRAARGPVPQRSAARCRGAPGAAAPLPPRGYTTAPGGRGAAGPRAAALRNRRSPDPVPLRAGAPPAARPGTWLRPPRGRGRYLS